MNRKLCFLLPTLLMAAFALTAASSGAGSPDAQPCSASVRDLVSNLRTDATQISADRDACVITHLKMHRGGRFNWEVDHLRIEKAPGPIPLWAGLRAVATGIRFSPDIPDAHARYLIRNQQRPFDAQLDYAFDLAAGKFQLKELTVESPTLGRISASVEGLLSTSSADLAAAKSVTSVATNGHFPDWKAFGVIRIHLVLDNKALFESMILPTWVSSVADDQDPAIAIPRQLAADEQQITQMPLSVINAESKQALIEFVRDLPHPSRHFDLTVVFAKPVEIMGENGLKPDGEPFWQRFSHIDARYVTVR